MIHIGQPSGNRSYGTRCPHCGKRTDQTPEELEQLERIGKVSEKIVKKMRRKRIKDDKKSNNR